jgi:hypothetical protein
MADINLHEEAESHEDWEGDAEFDAAIEDWLNGAGGDMLEQVQAQANFHANIQTPPVDVVNQEPPNYVLIRKELDDFFHMRVFIDNSNSRWYLRNNLPRKGKDTLFDALLQKLGVIDKRRYVARLNMYSILSNRH